MFEHLQCLWACILFWKYKHFALFCISHTVDRLIDWFAKDRHSAKTKKTVIESHHKLLLRISVTRKHIIHKHRINNEKCQTQKTVAKIHLEYSILNTCTSVFKYFRFEMYSQHCLQLSYKTLSSPYYRLQGRLYNNKANCLHFAPGGTLRHRRGWRIYQNSCFNINLKTVCVKESSACAGQWIKCHQHRFQLELCQIKQFRTTMHQNAIGGWAPPGPAGGA